MSKHIKGKCCVPVKGESLQEQDSPDDKGGAFCLVRELPSDCSPSPDPTTSNGPLPLPPGKLNSAENSSEKPSLKEKHRKQWIGAIPCVGVITGPQNTSHNNTAYNELCTTQGRLTI